MLFAKGIHNRVHITAHQTAFFRGWGWGVWDYVFLILQNKDIQLSIVEDLKAKSSARLFDKFRLRARSLRYVSDMKSGSADEQDDSNNASTLSPPHFCQAYWQVS
jgi:hypothetical protein